MTEYISAQQCADFKKGTCTDCYKFLGSRKHSKTIDRKKVTGIQFTVWAPAARSVRVVGDFNNWGNDENESGLMTKDENGFWYFFSTDVYCGQKYKYMVEHQSGKRVLKSDPYAYSSEVRPNTASIIYDLLPYDWTDSDWIENRGNVDYIHGPMNIYEMHLGSWKRDYENSTLKEGFMNYRQIADELAVYLKDMNYTHVEVMPVAEHPLDASWGYQTMGYYSITSRYGTPDDFRYFVNRMHEAGIGVIVDWVPGHFCKDDPGLYNFDGDWTYEHSEHDYRENVLWGTANFDLGKGTVRSFLISNALYFFREYHVDGLRVDAVANILYLDYEGLAAKKLTNVYGGRERIEGVEFLRMLNTAVFAEINNPLMIAEDSSAWPMVTKPVYLGGLGFNFKWNMGWMNDSLKYMGYDPIYRKWHHDKLTFSIMYAFSENYVLPLSHDEVVHGKKTIIDKMYGDYGTKFAALRAYYLYMMTHPGKKLNFMGNEFAPFLEWREYEALEWKMLNYPAHSSVKDYIKSLNEFYLNNKALWEIDDDYKGFQWIDANNSDQSVFSFIRYSNDPENFLVVICNFTPVEYKDFRLGVPRFADYEKVFSSYGDDNDKFLKPIPEGMNNLTFSLKFNLPGYGAMVYKPIFRKKNK